MNCLLGRNMKEASELRKKRAVSIGTTNRTPPSRMKESINKGIIESPIQGNLLGATEAISFSLKPSIGNQLGNELIDQILAWLKGHAGWHGKQAILNGCQTEGGRWDAIIKELLEKGHIEAEGDGVATRYRKVT